MIKPFLKFGVLLIDQFLQHVEYLTWIDARILEKFSQARDGLSQRFDLL
jgi:hypothetical protein